MWGHSAMTKTRCPQQPALWSREAAVTIISSPRDARNIARRIHAREGGHAGRSRPVARIGLGLAADPGRGSVHTRRRFYHHDAAWAALLARARHRPSPVQPARLGLRLQRLPLRAARRVAHRPLRPQTFAARPL